MPKNQLQSYFILNHLPDLSCWYPCLPWQMTDCQKCSPLSLASGMGLVNSCSMELWFLFGSSDFIPIIPLDSPVNVWISIKVNICDNKRSNNQTWRNLPALLCLIFYVFWCTLGRAAGADFIAHFLYQESFRVDCNGKWIYYNPARHQWYSSKLMKHEK